MSEALASDVPLLELRGVCREFRVGCDSVMAVRGVDVSVRNGEALGLVGPSGSGKSTLLNLLGLLDTPTAGRYFIDGRDTSTLSIGDRANLRNSAIGFVFQQFHLLPHLTAVQNVQLPLLYAGSSARSAAAAAEASLASVGMAHRTSHRPAQLSGGEKQRVAIARAVVGRPRVILADEPTGALDSATGEQVLDVLRGAAASSGAALIMITHDRGMADRLPRQVGMRDGRVQFDVRTAG